VSLALLVEQLVTTAKTPTPSPGLIVAVFVEIVKALHVESMLVAWLCARLDSGNNTKARHASAEKLLIKWFFIDK
jgi:hypothetical protein